MGISASGGYFNRPHFFSHSRDMSPEHTNPGSGAGYRANGWDRFLAEAQGQFHGLMTGSTFNGIPPLSNLLAPHGSLNVYFYGAEQSYVWGNHMYPNGRVQKTGRPEGEQYAHMLDRRVEDGFVPFNLMPKPRGEWFSYEFRVKLNTVVTEGTSPGPNYMYRHFNGSMDPNMNNMMRDAFLEHGFGHPMSPGPQQVPEDAVVLADGILSIWINGELALHFDDVIFRHTNTLKIDQICITNSVINGTTFTQQPGSIRYDNIVIATEYIGPVNLEGAR
jgi:hypothetical protein